jgi:hypothetical protein
MVGAFVMRGTGGVRPIRTRSPAGAMHRTGHDGHCGAAQRRDPRRKKNDGQIEREQSAQHVLNLQQPAQGEMPVRNPVTRRIRNPTLSSIPAERLRRADPASFASCG